jgi:glycosyltransferase involved in cell wall biosynthesis
MAKAIGATQYLVSSPAKRVHNPAYKALSLARICFGIPAGYSHVVCESCYYYPAIRRRTGGFRPKIINLNCGPTLYHLWSGRIGGIERKVLLSLLEEVDGHMVQGKFGMELVKELAPDKPAVKVAAYIPDGIYRERLLLQPELRSNEITIIATHDAYYKGLDLLISAFNLASKERKLRLNIIGNIPKADILRIEGAANPCISIHGRVDDLRPILERTALYVHPSRGDTFPVSSLEAMLSGIPTIVSRHTGTRDVVETVNPGMVCCLEAEDIAHKMLSYMELKDGKKEELGRRFRVAAMDYNEEAQLKEFAERYDSLIQEMGG